MISLGIDIGTTSICVAALDSEKKSILKSISTNHSFLEEGSSFLQNPDEIAETVKSLLAKIISAPDVPAVEAIGITCQMHGILYVDTNGRACSPFYTWKNGFGDRIFGEVENETKVTGGAKTYCQILKERTGAVLHTGYGSLTHFYLQSVGLLSKEACTFVSIGDYVGMRLTGQKTAKADPSIAASFGLFDLEQGQFDQRRIEAAGIDFSYYPEAAAAYERIGTVDIQGMEIPVCNALGDNQASFLGAVSDREKTVSVNVGTGSQVSVWYPRLIPVRQIEVRPFPGGGFLYVGASLNGGKVYEKLCGFFAEIGEAFGASGKETYEVMRRLAEKQEETSLVMVPDLYGQRQGQMKGAGIYSLEIENFHPGDFIRSFIAGMAEELHALYETLPKEIREKKVVIAASGNGLQRNKLLCDEIEKKFHMELQFTAYKEEAAAGAALYASHTFERSWIVGCGSLLE